MKRTIAPLALFALISGCGGGTSTGPGPMPSSIPTLPPTTPAPVGATTLYVANNGADSIFALPASASSGTLPTATIAGAATLLNAPIALAVDASGALWVANASTTQPNVLRFDKNANGDVAPSATLSSAAIGTPYGLAFDASGALYVSDVANNAIEKFAPGTTGTAVPVAVIQGSQTGLMHPHGIAFDAAGNLWVADTDVPSIEEFAAGASGNAAPIAVISGAAAQLTKPNALAFDRAGNLYVANVMPPSDGTVNIYAPNSTGNAAPIGQYTSAQYVGTPYGIALDSLGYVYVGDEGPNGRVKVYPPGTAGGAAPAELLGGIFNSPTGIALAP